MKVVSGGQTGVDRAALDAAIALGLAYGGWCPRGGWAEDFPTPPGLLACYPGLVETPSRDPAERTRWNVRDSDRTLILIDAGGIDRSRGTMMTLRLARQNRRPQFVVDLDRSDATSRVLAWLGDADDDLTLNVAGPRESGAPGIYEKARATLIRVLGRPSERGA